jgi:hypothetical protein
MNQEAPLDAHYEGERQRRLAGYSSQVTAMRQTLFKAQFGVKIQFGHDYTPVVWGVSIICDYLRLPD